MQVIFSLVIADLTMTIILCPIGKLLLEWNRSWLREVVFLIGYSLEIMINSTIIVVSYLQINLLWSTDLTSCVGNAPSLKKDVKLLKFQVIVQILMVLHFLVYNIYLFNSKEEEENTKEKLPVERSVTGTT